MDPVVLQLFNSNPGASTHYRNTEWLRMFLQQARTLNAYAGVTDKTFQTGLLFRCGELSLNVMFSDGLGDNLSESYSRVFTLPAPLAAVQPESVPTDRLPANHLFCYRFDASSSKQVLAVGYKFLPHPLYLQSVEGGALDARLELFRRDADDWFREQCGILNSPNLLFNYAADIDILSRISRD